MILLRKDQKETYLNLFNMKVFTEEVTLVLCVQRSPKDQKSDQETIPGRSSNKQKHSSLGLKYLEYLRKCKYIFHSN